MSVCLKTCRHIARRMMNGSLIMKLCMYVGYHDANNVSSFSGDPIKLKRFIVLFTLFYRHGAP